MENKTLENDNTSQCADNSADIKKVVDEGSTYTISSSTASSLANLKPELDRPWYYIDKHFIPDKCSYMIQEMRFACHLPFLFSIFTSFGLSKSQAGLISGLRLLGNIFGNLFWGFVADKTKKHRRILLLQAVCAILLFCSQPFVSIVYGNTATNQCPALKNSPSVGNLTTNNITNSSHNLPIMSTQKTIINSLKTIIDLNTNFGDTEILTRNNSTYSNQNQTIPPTVFIQSTVTNTSRNSGEDPDGGDEDTGNTTKLFWILLVMNIGVTYFDGFIPSLLDVAVIHKIEKTPYKTEFGTQRKFGTLGYAAGVVITNSIIEAAPRMGITCFSLNFAVYAGLIVLETICIYLMYSKKNIHQNAQDDEAAPELVPVTKTNQKYFKTIFKTCTKFSSVMFFLTVFISGMQLASKAFFVVTYLKEKNAPSLLFNLFFVVSSLSIFLGLELSDKIIKTLGGTWNTFIAVFLCYCIKFFALVTLPNVWSLILTEVLDFVCQGCAIPAAILHTNSISTDSNRTTMFGFVNSLQFGFGFIFANIIGGFIYEYYGGVTFYGIQAVISLAWTLVLVSYRLYLKWSEGRPVESTSHEMKVNF